jgi:hypothetical protein
VSYILWGWDRCVAGEYLQLRRGRSCCKCHNLVCRVVCLRSASATTLTTPGRYFYLVAVRDPGVTTSGSIIFSVGVLAVVLHDACRHSKTKDAECENGNPG